MILAAALVAHWVMWTPREVQIGVGIGKAPDERLIALVPAEGCAAGVKFYDGRYGDLDRVLPLIAHSKVCEDVESRRKAVSNLSRERPAP